jgi:regulator of cell morphogenesis and NO signaling
VTAMFEKMVGEIAAEIPASGQVFENHHIDYCCGGKRRFRDACRLAGVNPGEVEAEILAASESTAAAPRDWQAMSLKDLIFYMVEIHHAYLRRELPSLGRMMVNLADLQGGRTGDLLPLRRALSRLIAELQAHINKEEAVLFPAIIGMEQAVNANEPLPTALFGSVRNPIWMMEQEHAAAASILKEIRSLIGDYTLRGLRCEMFRVLCQALQLLEADLHEHIHLENNILFPRAMQLEAQLNREPHWQGPARWKSPSGI